MIVGRDVEIQQLRGLIHGAGAGFGGGIVLAGEPGIGKSALVRTVLSENTNHVWLAGVETERDLPYAAIGVLCAPYLDRLAGLESGQRQALDTVLGRSGGDQPGRLLVGMALLALLAEVADGDPFVVVVDDMQWVDRPSLDAILFVARRIAADSLAIIFTVRTTVDGDEWTAGLPRIELRGLVTDDASELLRDAPPLVVAQLIELTGGNPLALIEAKDRLSAAELAGTEPISALAVTRPEKSFAHRFDALPRASRAAARIVGVAGDAPRDVITSALTDSGLALSDLAAVEATGLLRFGERAMWHHPLARSAAARGPIADVVAAHASLASGWNVVAPKNPARAWHLAESTVGPDEVVSKILVEAGEFAERHDASADAADAFERAARLSPQLNAQLGLLERAATSAARAGLTARAADVLDVALQSLPEGEQSAPLLFARGRLAYVLGDAAHAYELLLGAVVATDDADLCVRAAQEACFAASLLERPEAVQLAADLAIGRHDDSDPAQIVLTLHSAATVARLCGDVEACRVAADEIWSVAVRHGLLESEPMVLLSTLTSEYDSERLQALRAEERAAIDSLRIRGDLTWLPQVLLAATHRQLFAGWIAGCYDSYIECELLARLAGQAGCLAESLIALAEWDAYRGDDALCFERSHEAEQLIKRYRLRRWAGWPAFVQSLVATTRRDPGSAAKVIRNHIEDQDWMIEELGYLLAEQGMLNEIAELSPDTERAALGDATGIVAALTRPDDRDKAADLIKLAAVDHLPHDRGRLLLMAAGWLRRCGQRNRARDVLEEALTIFTKLGATPWIERTQAELGSSGTIEKRGTTGLEALTPSELRVCELVAEGLPNKKVAALLFVSPKTVEFHLSGAFRKLGVANRTALARELKQRPST